MATHEKLVEDATDAINAVHGDTSVSREQTIDSLSELAGQCEMLIAATRTDIENNDSKGDGGGTEE